MWGSAPGLGDLLGKQFLKFFGHLQIDALGAALSAFDMTGGYPGDAKVPHGHGRRGGLASSGNLHGFPSGTGIREPARGPGVWS